MIFKIPPFWSFYFFGWPKVLPANYTFSLTFKCNSRCQTCRIWQKKQATELSRVEWRKVFLSLGKSPFWVTLSGGEPFMRKDLEGIVSDLCQISQPKIVTLPTNGLLTKKIKKDVQLILKRGFKTRLIVNLSLDGVGERHDQIRGVKGNFKKTIRTYKELKKIKSKRLTVGIHSVISRQNIDHFPALGDYVIDELKPDSYVTEIAENRHELKTMGMNITPKISEYKKAIDYLNFKTKKKRIKSTKLIRAFRTVYYQLTIQTLTKKEQIIPCFAGVASAQIAPNGDVWPCCVRADVLGNLKKENFDFKKIWFSKKADEKRRSIKNRQCYCPLANVSYTNILLNPRMMVQVIGNYF